MNKTQNEFSSLLEGVLVNVWGGAKERLSTTELVQTRNVLVVELELE